MRKTEKESLCNIKKQKLNLSTMHGNEIEGEKLNGENFWDAVDLVLDGHDGACGVCSRHNYIHSLFSIANT